MTFLSASTASVFYLNDILNTLNVIANEKAGQRKPGRNSARNSRRPLKRSKQAR